jgi:arsenate reductase
MGDMAVELGGKSFAAASPAMRLASGLACANGDANAGWLMLTIYTLANCDTCRRATKWLRAHDVTFTEKPIRETPPSVAELKTMLGAYDGELRRLFNTSGRDYRDLNLGEKLPAMTEAEALKLLSSNGNLVKRPFLLGTNGRGRKNARVGFDEAAWTAALLGK